jgi:hypothetical protein
VTKFTFPNLPSPFHLADIGQPINFKKIGQKKIWAVHRMKRTWQVGNVDPVDVELAT